ncbi:precorrin-2 C(20)-methyltransferase [Larsenimonas rhizosphaerae]|uniref:Precorrin-2 C(20)-methyltransferase n=1 Tax=Larsenimonas rhizosphaerae TaxID=2944682 RepID=A0AA41ZK83_9GAMM|nr:precorrin-2 C(20)-methyltransferase [Larsenimonas rhizosphaerae]MCM2130478.1 precorrin-2 C(20)-methyltransferase [Larsenimonas rhizosphaerae]MCX2523183.1 precorrin-2 C(20)-methyltransferase [Larsenimonas rhizosphaerae]
MSATFYGIGVGPGDPELMTLKAHRVLQRVDVVCYITNAKGYSLAADIARDSLPATRRQRHLTVQIDMSHDRTTIDIIYERTAGEIRRALENGQDVAFLCEGDPLFFGSFAYLLARLADDFPCETIPGISSLHAASAATGLPLTMLGEHLAIISARDDDDRLRQALDTFDTLVIMKGGRKRHTITAAIAAAGRLNEGYYLEHLSTPRQALYPDLTRLPEGPGPYFSLFVVSRRHRGGAR